MSLGTGLNIVNLDIPPETITVPFAASKAVQVGDLMFWSSTVAKTADQQADQGTESLNQSLFQTLFLGVSADQRLSSETDTPDRMIIVDGIFDCSCTSSTFDVGDLVAAVEQGSGDALENRKVKKTTDASTAIGYVVKRYGSATTTVRCRLIGRYTPNTVRTGSTGLSYTPSQVNVLDGNSFMVGDTSLRTISNGDGSTSLVPTAQIVGTTKTDGSLLLMVNSATATSAAAPSVNLVKSANATLGSNTVVASGEILGEVNFFGADGTDFKSCAVSCRAVVDATPGTGDMAGRWSVFCSADGAETPLEKMRLVGTASTADMTLGVAGTSTGTLYLSGATSGTVGLRATAAAGSVVFILPAAVGTNGQQLTTDGNAGTATMSWAAAGSLRAFKDVLAEVSDRADDVLRRLVGTPVYDFRYKDEPDAITTRDFATTYRGIMAEDLPEVMHHEGRIFNPVSAFGELLLAVKALAQRIDALAAAR